MNGIDCQAVAATATFRGTPGELRRLLQPGGAGAGCAPAGDSHAPDEDGGAREVLLLQSYRHFDNGALSVHFLFSLVVLGSESFDETHGIQPYCGALYSDRLLRAEPRGQLAESVRHDLAEVCRSDLGVTKDTYAEASGIGQPIVTTAGPANLRAR